MRSIEGSELECFRVWQGIQGTAHSNLRKQHTNSVKEKHGFYFLSH